MFADVPLAMGLCWSFVMSAAPDCPPDRTYVLISPCRDEAAFLQRTVDAIAHQTLRPKRWIIVDDGSTDNTPTLLAQAAQQYDFIQVVQKPDRGMRAVGPGVVEAFYAGYEYLQNDDYTYIGKLDMDVDMPPIYFETLMRRMEENPRLGTCSGKPYFYQGDQRVSEKCGDETSVGMIKFYRRTCFEQVGGFVREVMWDVIDCHRCRMLGWIACSWDEPELRFVHLRAMGSSDRGLLRGRMRLGYGQYFMGTEPLYLLISAAYRSLQPPLLVGGLAIAWGYFWSAWMGKPRYGDRAFRTFLHHYHWRCLRHGKPKATAELDQQQASVWNPTGTLPPLETCPKSTE